MNKKFKYTSLVAAGAVTLGLVGGTLAWWSSMDSVTNNFKTLGDNYNPEEPNKGITIVEDFDYTKEKPAPVTPGSNVNKDVQVQNDVDYPQFIKVTFEKQFLRGGKVITEIDDKTEEGTATKFQLKTDLIELKFTSHVVDLNTESLPANPVEGTWYEYDDTYYYYGKVAPVGTEDNYTNTLLDSVTLSSKAGNHYQNLDFQVIVNAKSIQASNGAATAEWFTNKDTNQLETGVLGYLNTQFKDLESKETYTEPVDILEPNNNANDNHTHSPSTK